MRFSNRDSYLKSKIKEYQYLLMLLNIKFTKLKYFKNSILIFIMIINK